MDLLEQMRDNLFSANHRNAMVTKHGYTEAMRVTLQDLLDDHDCKSSEESGCQSCKLGEV